MFIEKILVTKGENIFFVESILKVIKNITEILGEEYEVDIAKNTLKIKKYIKENEYKMVILDFDLRPTKKSFEILDILQKKYPKTIVVVLTCMTSCKTITNIKKYNSKIILKPIMRNGVIIEELYNFIFENL